MNSDPRYLACSIETKSEIVAPIFVNGKVVGELDIDSHVPAAFTDDDRTLVEHCAGLVGRYLETRRMITLSRSAEERGSRLTKQVVAALIVRADEILCCQRTEHQALPLKWEFPGGKIEAGETPEEALRRELEEELGIRAEIGREITRVLHTYLNGNSVDLRFFVVEPDSRTNCKTGYFARFDGSSGSNCLRLTSWTRTRNW